jgi:superfamily II DNA/RNA helicase
MVVKMFLEKQAEGRGIIFTNQRNQAEDLFKYLSEKMPKLKMKLLHGDLEKKDREAAIRSFVEKKAQILVATDVAARGIDIQDLVWVLNYGLPKTGIYYLHRCGRVARGGRKGIVYNLVASHDAKMIAQINEAIMNQKHLNLDIIPEDKMKEDKQVVKKYVEKVPATFRGKTQRARGAARVQKTEKELRNAPAERPKRNRGIKRRR